MSACGERTGPLEPMLIRLDTPASAVRAESKAKVLKRSKALATDIVASTTVTPAGGTLSIPDAGLLVVFPKGAVSRNLVVTATANGGKDVVYSFEPHGTQFNLPIAIAQLSSLTTYGKKKGEILPDIHGGYLLRGPSDVDALGSATFSETFPAAFEDRGGGTYVYFFTNHFSGFALASGILRISVDLPNLPILDP
ncbi:MAG TPA: hypothetical protein VIF32_03360 [Gemmatimonadaceae bacterium]